uniref:Uncharacterized protein n=1 Tax=Megaselia scalaris TaxID=36166 RepID=T1GVH8_MEGSC
MRREFVLRDDSASTSYTQKKRAEHTSLRCRVFLLTRTSTSTAHWTVFGVFNASMLINCCVTSLSPYESKNFTKSYQQILLYQDFPFTTFAVVSQVSDRLASFRGAKHTSFT